MRRLITQPVRRGAPARRAALSVLLAVAGTLAAGAPARAQNDLPWMDASLPPQQRTELLLDAMRLDEKIQQAANRRGYNPELDDGDPANGGPCDPQPTSRHIEGIPALAIPTMRFSNGGTGIRGGDCIPELTATGVPSGIAGAATFNPELNLAWGRVLGNELRAWAHHAMWGPGVNLIRTPFGGRNQEYMSEDPYLTGVTAVQQIRGVQATGETHAMVKHFVGNESEYQKERWTAASRIPSRAMHELYLLPFEMAVKEGDVAAVMCAFPHVNFDWACENQALLRTTLRQRWGFDGYVASDRQALRSTAASIRAGVTEVDFDPEWYTPERVKAALAAGEISEADLDDVLRGRYTKMFAFGHFDVPFDRFRFDRVDYAANSEVARRAAEEAITLLKNANRVLPLRPDAGQIALIGPSWFAGQATLPPRSADPDEMQNVVTDPALTVSPLAGLRNTLARLGSDSEVTYDDGRDVAHAIALAQRADAVILMVGDNPRDTLDKATLALPTITGTDQQRLIPAILAANPNTVVVLKTSGMVDTPWLDDARAVVEAWYPGQQDGNAVANVLFGVTNPSGKLPVTWGNSEREAAYSSTAQYPGLREDNGLLGGPGVNGDGSPQLVTHYTEGLELGYRWYAANHVKPLFAFGHGLSYTTFDYSDLGVTLDYADGRPVVSVSYTIANTGLRDGKEASQVYLTLPAHAGEPPMRLVGFKKVDLRRGRSGRVTVTLDAAAANHPLSYFQPKQPENLLAWADGDWVTPSGTFTVHVGGSSAKTPLRQTFELPPPAAGPRPAAVSPPAPQAAIAGRNRRASRRRLVRVRVRCPLSIGPRGCKGTLTAARGQVRVARARVRIPAGRTATVKLRLTGRAYRLLLRRGSMTIRLRLRIDAGGHVRRSVRVVAPRRH
jgi:beta-glucosidase